VVESYIYRGPDWQVGEQTVRAGDWLVGAIWNPDVWAMIKSGELTGFSFQGRGKRRPAPEAVVTEER
jgi:hypothetical protein